MVLEMGRQRRKYYIKKIKRTILCSYKVGTQVIFWPGQDALVFTGAALSLRYISQGNLSEWLTVGSDRQKMSAWCRWCNEGIKFFKNLPDGGKEKTGQSATCSFTPQNSQHQRKLVCLMMIPLGLNLVFEGRFLNYLATQLPTELMCMFYRSYTFFDEKLLSTKC